MKLDLQFVNNHYLITLLLWQTSLSAAKIYIYCSSCHGPKNNIKYTITRNIHRYSTLFLLYSRHIRLFIPSILHHKTRASYILFLWGWALYSFVSHYRVYRTSRLWSHNSVKLVRWSPLAIRAIWAVAGFSTNMVIKSWHYLTSLIIAFNPTGLSYCLKIGLLHNTHLE